MHSFDPDSSRPPRGDQPQCVAKLRCWHRSGVRGQIFAGNLDCEHFLDVDGMEALHRVVSQSDLEEIDAIDQIDALEDRFQKACHDHVLKGGPASPTFMPTVVGRAVERDTFIGWLFDKQSPRVFADVLQVTEFVDKLVRGEKPDSTEEVVLMSSFGSWVTWNAGDPEGDPFHFLREDMADEVRANLGLDPRRRCSSQRLLLLVYERADLELLRPTIADAGLYLYFTPPPRFEKRHGFTRPWLHGDRGTSGSGFRVAPRPEAVHAATSFARIQSVRELL